jgi:hypothetical protein
LRVIEEVVDPFPGSHFTFAVQLLYAIISPSFFYPGIAPFHFGQLEFVVVFILIEGNVHRYMRISVILHGSKDTEDL